MSTTIPAPSAKAIWLVPLSGIAVALMLGQSYLAILDADRGHVTLAYLLSFLGIPVFPLINAVISAQLMPKHEWRRRLPAMLVTGLVAGLVYAYAFMLLVLNTMGS